MQFRISKVFLASVLLVSMIGLVACTPPSPEERVAATRAEYIVKLNAFVVQEPEIEAPVIETMPDDTLVDAAGAEVVAVTGAVAATVDEVAGEEGAEGEEMMMDEEVVPMTRNVLFDLVVIFNGKEPLDGLTLDISQADPFEKEKATFRHYVELGPMVKAETKQVSFTLEDIEYEEGDLFSVNLREYVAPEVRGEYREFAEAQ